jgi:hypothetical protein
LDKDPAKLLSVPAKSGGNTNKYESAATSADWFLISASHRVLSEGQAFNGFNAKHASRDDTINIPAGGTIDLGHLYNTAAKKEDLTFQYAVAGKNGDPVTGGVFNGKVEYIGTAPTVKKAVAKLL